VKHTCPFKFIPKREHLAHLFPKSPCYFDVNDTIADFILERGRRVQAVERLKQQFAAAGFQTKIPNIYR
jgi:hypothetical protein